MRAQSLQKVSPLKDFYDGFTSDYYSYHNLEKRKSLYSKKYIFSKKEEIHPEEHEKENLKHHKKIFCVPIGYQFDLKTILISMHRVLEEFDSPEVEHLKNVTIFKISKTNQEKLIFLFDFGVLVLWSFEEEEEIELSHIFFKNCKYIINSQYSLNTDKMEEVIKSLEDEGTIFYFKKGENFNIQNRNKITIESNDVSEILSIAYALAQHTILAHYESEVATTIEETKSIPIEMRDKGQINLTKKEISRNIGLIFMRRSAVNLNSDILDTPDIFWEQRNEMENYYATVRKYLDIDKRVSILDRRMKILKELYDVMNNEIKTQGKFRLEWIVVYLIVIEIFVSIFWKMLVKDILKLY